MTVNALYPDYTGQPRDGQDRFHGGVVVYVSWARHLMFTNPYAFLVMPDLKVEEFVTTMLAPAYGPHPDWAKIDWASARWTSNGKPVTLDPAQTIGAAGVHHKMHLQLETPGLDGIGGSGI